MKETLEDTISRKVALIECNHAAKLYERPCYPCIAIVRANIADAAGVDAKLIETTAIAIANLNGDYVADKITPLEYRFAFRLLEEIIPSFLEGLRTKSEFGGIDPLRGNYY